MQPTTRTSERTIAHPSTCADSARTRPAPLISWARAGFCAALLLTLVVTPFLPGCSGCATDGGTSGPEPGCADNDGDGYGEGCSAGDDCNDFNPTIQVCDCTVDNFAGCECTSEGASEPCFDGLDEQLNVGVCIAGQRRCEGGMWTACLGQIPPIQEICNDRDDDCDGTNDEELAINLCGTCDPNCGVETVGGGGGGDSEPWNLNEENSDGVVETDEGIQLTQDGFDFRHLWISNSEEGTVSKVDTETGREVARYVSAIRVSGNMPPSTARCPLGGGTPPGNCPSRTAVDLQGNVWVANRAFAGQGSVTKIADRNCLDKDGDGTVETSNDANGDGRININDPAEFFGEQDECLLFTVTIGGNQSIPRALAIDPFAPVRGIGSVWVGAWGENRYYQIDANDGSLIRQVDVAHRPYGAVMDRFGVLWSADCDCFGESNAPPPSLISIISATGDTDGPFAIRSTTGCANSYGITIDRNDYIWVGGFECQTAHRYDPASDGWFTVQLGSNVGLARGIAADRDGNIYVGHSHDTSRAVGHVSYFREDGSDVNRWTFTSDGSGTIGVGLDTEERVWAINQSTGTATRITPSNNRIEHFPVGDGPYTYSDFTGFALRNFTAPTGFYRRRLMGCPSDQKTIWLGVNWESEEPPGTGVGVTVRAADTEDELVTAPSFGPFDESPADLRGAGVPPSYFLDVEFELRSDVPDATPILKDFSITWTCEGPG